jgi:hypothetical protein
MKIVHVELKDARDGERLTVLILGGPESRS